ncbi:hypothetical protein N7451_008527 [Penicillium sp. IBT 35674x]|nr:hypothetical protein N7451_008527 [Penicillium sp. IBT 35674x]
MEEGLFMPDCIPQQVALLALYMPIICERVQSWTDIWNMHPIRKQKNRPHVVTGKPMINYFDSDTCDPPVEDRKWPFDPESEVIQTLQLGIQEWDLNKYLPPPTLLWYRTQLHEIGQEFGLPVGSNFDPANLHIQLIGDTRQPRRAVYEKLRLRALAHWHSGEEPILGVCEKPSAECGS